MNTDDLVERLFGSLLGTIDVLSIHVGDQLGLYALLREHGPCTTSKLADLAAVDARYAREWLEQQVVSGLLDVDDSGLPEAERRFSLSEEHARVLVDRDELSYLTPVARIIAAAAAQMPQILQAYRDGGGVSWEQFGPAMRTGQAEGNRPSYLILLTEEWLPRIPGLELGPGSRVADIGCGEGWSSVAMAIGIPGLIVDGFDVDTASVAAAGQHALDSGVADRVTFTAADAGTVAGAGGYDLVTAFECIHDLPDPVAVLRTMRSLARPGAIVMVMDERVAEEFTGASGDMVEQLMYGFSLFVCLPDSKSTPGSRATGTVMRPEVLRGYAIEAGFADITVLPIENDLWRFYQLVG